MPNKFLTDRDIKGLVPNGSQQNKSTGDGNGLTICVARDAKGGTKHFEGRFRFQGVQDSIRLGVYGKEITLRDARKKWRDIYEWYWKNECLIHPKNFKIEHRSRKTLLDACNLFIDSKDNVKPITLQDYKNKLYNQVLPVIDGKTPLKILEWDNGGRATIQGCLDGFKSRGKHEQERRTRNVLIQVFDLAIEEGWMQRNQNPALKPKVKTVLVKKKRHPCITWEQVPELLEAIKNNECNGDPITIMSVKFLLMSFLRVGALVRLEWDWFDEENDRWEIPSQTSGLKRGLGVEDEPHFIPVSEELRELMDALRKHTGFSKYVFYSPRGKGYGHITPDTPNHYLHNLGYRGMTTAHGWRQMPLTAGQDVLKISHEIIQRQMGHLFGDKVRRAYDRSQMLDERREFLSKWSALLVEKGLVI